MWVKKLFPQTVAKLSSSYNQDIRVVMERGAYKLLVNGARQSGEYISELWLHAFTLLKKDFSPKKILVLGVAGGTVMHLLHKKFPDATITGVDIDKTMIDVGKKYFGLSEFTLIEADAKEFVKQQSRAWDLIVIDLFIGASIPPFVASDDFLEQIKEKLRPGGSVLVNYLYEREYIILSDHFDRKLKKIFRNVTDTKIYYNRFFLVW